MRESIKESDDVNTNITALTRQVEAIAIKQVNVVSSEPDHEVSCMVYDSRDHRTDECPSIPTLREVMRDSEDVNAKITALTRQVEALTMKQVNVVSSEPVHEVCCVVCDGRDHRTDECPSIPALREVMHGQVNAVNSYNPVSNQGVGNPYAPTYNSGWRNHPNFSWKNEGAVVPQQYQAPTPPQYQPPSMQPYQAPLPYQPPHKKSLEDTLFQFIQTQASENARVNRSLEDMNGRITLFTQSMSTHDKGQFPAQPQPNPTRQVNMIQSLESNHEHVESITTLRSGKVIDKSIPPKESESMGESPRVNDEERVGEEEREIERIGNKEKESEKKRENDLEVLAHAPFPHRLTKSKHELHHSDIYEMFKQVKINIPLLDAIK